MEGYTVKLYNEDNIEKNYAVDHLCGEGGCAYIYQIDKNTCIKLFGEDYMIDDRTIKIIKNLKLTNFYEIYELLYDKEHHFSGYTMNYLKSEDIDILRMPTYYTLDNLYKLYKSFETLTENNIYAYDCDTHNIIINSKNINIIDTDIYYFYEENEKEKLRIDNYKLLLHLFKAVYYEQMKYMGYSLKDCDYLLDDLFDYRKEITNTEKKLVRYKYPIEYINKHMEDF